ncbi:peptidoglycan DD-metalloendopeptidase family protein [Pelagibacterium montanilacus]|uniref:peptidoglycan DD-metalloendopeptidase family protein n=1 Tax=Pelagibacterium montanilacus TaxID=2185280 RepID=UPI001FEB3B94|nr:peptidoglycan DD-metalloendopeptidase family protein [Pelagibacterium montanilacus]
MMPRLFALAAATLLSAPALGQDAFEFGRERSDAFLAGDLEGIWEAMSPEMQDALGSLEAFEQFRADLAPEIGQEVDILDEVVRATPQGEFYVRTGRWDNAETPVVMQWAFAEDGTILGFYVQPEPEAAPSQHLDYTTRADLRLPFEGEWSVYWGGRTVAQNYHAVDPIQRFAVDFVVERDGATFEGDPLLPENYHCWGQEILAPADGLVVAAVRDLPDQVIGETDPENPAGNHVILNLADDEYAFLAHLQAGSVQVQLGDEVSQGDVLGLCGNSGNTSEPHLHFHLQTTPDLLEGEGIPAQFLDYAADGEPVDRGEPMRGQIVTAN